MTDEAKKRSDSAGVLGVRRVLRKGVMNKNKDSSPRSSDRKSGKEEEVVADQEVDTWSDFLKAVCANQEEWKTSIEASGRDLSFPRLSQGSKISLCIAMPLCVKRVPVRMDIEDCGCKSSTGRSSPQLAQCAF